MDDVAWSARANLEQPDVEQRVHEGYIRADAEVISQYVRGQPGGPGARRARPPRPQTLTISVPSWIGDIERGNAASAAAVSHPGGAGR